MMRSTVDLPEPFRPRTPIFAPGKNDRLMSRRITRLGGTTFETRFMVNMYWAKADSLDGWEKKSRELGSSRAALAMGGRDPCARLWQALLRKVAGRNGRRHPRDRAKSDAAGRARRESAVPGYNLPESRATPRLGKMFSKTMTITGFDAQLAAAIANEERRQEEHIELIASENYASPRVLEAQGSVLTNKYAEGYPGKRYYGGCEYIDVVEQLAIDRAKQLFGADFANVQPHSGSQANAAAYLALIQPGDVILGMSLDHGGHLTHGAKVNFSGKLFRAVQYGIHPDTGEIDYEQVQRLAEAHKTRMIT